jgi:hypothetical protein
MPFVGQQPAEVALTTGDLGDDIVTLAKITSGTDGELITWDASGNPTTVAAGTSGHFLKSQGSGSVPVFADVGGGGFSFIDSTNVTAVSDISFTDLADGYDYLIQLENVDIASDSNGIYFQLGVAGPTYRTSGYLMSVAGIRGTGTYHNQETNFGVMLATGEGTGSNEHLYFSQTMLLNPANAATKTTTFGQNIYYNYQPLNCGEFTGGRYDTAEANTCIKIYPGSGNFSSGGTIRRYRRARS